MTKERALKEAQKIANATKNVMVVVNDPVTNNPEDEPDGPWGYCPYKTRHTSGPLYGKLILYPWVEEEIIVVEETKLSDVQKSLIADRILDTLNRQKFNDWYTRGRFDAYISGDNGCPTKDEILDDIKKLFRITDWDL